jgi:hypothetical protein
MYIGFVFSCLFVCYSFLASLYDAGRFFPAKSVSCISVIGFYPDSFGCSGNQER